MNRVHRRRRIGAWWALACPVAAVAGTLAFGGVAAAQEVVPPEDPAVDQYVPSLPVAEGERSPTLGRGLPGSGLDPQVRDHLPRGPEGALLSRLATSPGLGAPRRASGEKTGRQDGDDGSSSAGGRRDLETRPSALSALVDVATEPSALLLLVSLAVFTVLLAVFGRRRSV